jgi:hypothetical protein
MDAWDSWSRQIRHLSGELDKIRYGNYAESNGLASPASLEQLASLKARFLGHDLTQLISFYSRSDGASFPSLWNGYFIHPVRLLLRVREDIPVRVEGSLTREILPFGSDGGGNLIALSLGQQKKDVLYLPHGRIKDRTYRDSPPMLMKVLAEDFDEFLDRLLKDLRAYIDRTPGWQYMDGGTQ